MARTPATVSVSESPRHRPITAAVRESTEDKKLTADPKHFQISVTATSQWSCPEVCPLFNNGCYAEVGNMRFVTGRLNASTEHDPVEIARTEAAGIRALSGQHPLRLKIVGDSKTNEAARIVRDACDDYRGKHDQPVWGYTHAWRDVDRESHGDTSILASCETEEDARLATDRGYAVAMVFDDSQPMPAEVAGMAVIPCRQQTGAAPDCARCTLRGPVCAIDTKLRGRRIIGFKGHGATRKVRAALAARRSNG